MESKTRKLLKDLINLSQDIAKGHYGNAKDLFELTKKTGAYPDEITGLAESFGMMLVKVEAREFNLKKIIDQLKTTQVELELSKDKLLRENVSLKKSLGLQFSPKRIIGQSRKMMDIMKQVEKVADTPVNVLITGETGTGKELIAKALHYNSTRNTGPFIALNCTAIPDTLMESELFGIEKGVATGVERRTGRIEQAQGGTLFLDEIGDMPLTSQGKILRILEERELLRLGGKKPIPVDIRIVAATNKNLRHEAEHGTFRKDLYFRLNVVHLHIPPLRERREDIPLLLKTFLHMYAHKMGRAPLQCSAEAMECLKMYSWPGNVRELENEVERLVALASTPIIAREDLSYEVRRGEPARVAGEFGSADDMREREKELIRKVLEASGGKKSEAAKRLGLSREGLRKKIKRYGIA